MLTEKHLGTAHPTDTNNLTLYTTPALTTTIIKSIRVCNTASSDVKFRIFRVTSGGSAGIANAVYYDINLPAHQSIGDDGFLVLETGDSLVVQAEVANTLTFTLSGGEISG